MPWETFKLNNGAEMLSIGYGTGRQLKGRTEIDAIKQALSLGYTHIDTSDDYLNEDEVGQAIKESRVARKNLFITSKYSHETPADAHTAIRNSLRLLGVSYVDLYIIHRPSVALQWEGIPALWRSFEDFQRKGWTKGIGVSNFNIEHLKIILAKGKVKPVVNQILFHPYVWAAQEPVLDFCKANGIVVEAYGSLLPLRENIGGPLDKPLARIAEGRRTPPEQILLAWVKAKGVVAITTSLKRERLQGYLDAGDVELTDSEIAAIDAAGREGAIEPPPDGKKY